MILPKN